MTADHLYTDNLFFFIDHEPSGHFAYTPSPQGPHEVFNYNVLLWAGTNLANGPHTFALQNSVPQGNISTILFDYIIYT